MASHDLSNTKATILGATPGAIPGSDGNPHERFHLPWYSRRFFSRIGVVPTRQKESSFYCEGAASRTIADHFAGSLTTIGDELITYIYISLIPTQHRDKNYNCSRNICGCQGRTAPINTFQHSFPQEYCAAKPPATITEQNSHKKKVCNNLSPPPRRTTPLGFPEFLGTLSASNRQAVFVEHRFKQYYLGGVKREELHGTNRLPRKPAVPAFSKNLRFPASFCQKSVPPTSYIF